MSRFTAEQIAIVVHEANRGLQRVLEESVNFPWENERPSLKASVIDGVNKILSGEITEPGDSHRNWLAFKEAEGWTYGEVKDFDKKTHPQFVPFEDLPAEQQLKDELFYSIVTQMAVIP